VVFSLRFKDFVSKHAHGRVKSKSFSKEHGHGISPSIGPLKLKTVWRKVRHFSRRFLAEIVRLPFTLAIMILIFPRTDQQVSPSVSRRFGFFLAMNHSLNRGRANDSRAWTFLQSSEVSGGRGAPE